MITKVELSLLSADDVLPLRQKVLRPLLKPIECQYAEDKSSTTFHIGLNYNKKLISVATFMLQSSPLFGAGYPFRLRGMATEENYRGQGFGGQLLRYGLHLLKEKRCDLVWCNARLKAFSFYQSSGFQFQGPLFEIEDIGPHKVMYKIIIPR